MNLGQKNPSVDDNIDDIIDFLNSNKQIENAEQVTSTKPSIPIEKIFDEINHMHQRKEELKIRNENLKQNQLQPIKMYLKSNT